MSDITKNIKEDPYRLGFHLMPPAGWLNDPNGLCEFKGKYHVFFQYAPDSADGRGKKCWGHYIGESLTEFSFAGAPLLPDNEKDSNGVYSGCALVDDDEVLLYYTGNVKQTGEHDYTYSGREANTVLVSMTDGDKFSEKLCLMENRDYPEEYTCHVRDPKVWKQDGKYFMVQGGRLDGRKSGGDKGAVIVFDKTDDAPWKALYSITTERPFGYMWECPDYFEKDGVKLLSCSPQGLESEEYRYQNVYQSGYFVLPDDFDIAAGKSEKYAMLDDPDRHFREWDMGFDFYAPQTFEDEKGRRILIGWAGIPDADYDNEPTVKRGWQHALTLPREITVSDEGKVMQYPVAEIESLRQNERVGHNIELPLRRADIMADIDADRLLSIGSASELLRISDASGELFSLTLSREAEKYLVTLQLSEGAGRGRKSRKILLDDLHWLRLVLDTSLAEIYLNDGEYVMTTRFYADEEIARKPYILHSAGDVKVWDMKEMKVVY